MATQAINNAGDLLSASQKYGVPIEVLVGVFGMETAFGENVATSSTGAQGFMQFEPATARAYNYPLTNNPTPAQAQQQIFAAAHYLSDLYNQHGHNWDSALRAYSGGGYGLAEVQAKSKSAPPSLRKYLNEGLLQLRGSVPVLSDAAAPFVAAAGAIGDVGKTAGDAAAALGSIASLLTSASFWIRLGEAIAGVILIAMGLRSLTGSTTTPVTLAKAAVR